jgi:hypothetical protein
VLDVLIRGATVYPGEAPPFRGDFGVEGGSDRLCDTLVKRMRPRQGRTRSSTGTG